MERKLVPPFPWFGGKRRVADVVWERFGRVRTYIEPFFGAGAVLLARPEPAGLEIINDKDAMVANFWRAVKWAPDEVAGYADWPVNEVDLTARHRWLIHRKEELRTRLLTDPDYFDAKVAGWWAWGLSSWIGHGWCTSKAAENPKQKPQLTSDDGLTSKIIAHDGSLRSYMRCLADRLRRVKVCCGDWARVCTPVVLFERGPTGVFLDPPYGEGRHPAIYDEDTTEVIQVVREWCLEHGRDSRLRIALCGYEGQIATPGDWETYRWKARGGYGLQGTGRGRANRERETIWFSPHCLPPRQRTLFDTGITEKAHEISM